MKRFHVLSLMFVILFGLCGMAVQASAPSLPAYSTVELLQQQQQSITPIINSFEAAVINVSRNALTNRTARIPVSWEVLNRPANSNLSFDQVMPDGTLRNVELPRDVAYVSSVGVGVAAPFDPGATVSEITLRLSLIDLSTSTVLRDSTITVAIGNQPNPPRISLFTSEQWTVARSTLVNRTARIPVSWAVIARPENSNLSFDQVMPDGTLRNVELPRSIAYVSSAGSGLAAPFDPSTTATEIVLRLSLIDLGTSIVLAQSNLTIIIGDQITTPQIRSFTTSAVSVPRTSLANRSTRIPVAWEVTNRPANCNLMFDQVMPDGTLRNVELPRPIAYVSSSGVGVAAPFDPGATATEIVLRLSVIDLSTATVLVASTITLPIAADGSPLPGIQFDVQPRNATTGDRVTLTWDAGNVAGVGILIHFAGMPTTNNSPLQLESQSNTPSSTQFNFPARGSTQVEIGINRRDYTFWLIYPDSSLESGVGTTNPISVDVTFDCLDEWFADIGQQYCPTQTVQNVEAAYQSFERGFMVWQSGKIWVFPTNGLLRSAPDTWNGEDITFGQTPPAGLLLPQHGFGTVWTQNQAIRDALGWATQAEQSYTMQRQYAANSTGATGGFYTFSLPNNQVMYLYENGAGAISESLGPINP